MTRRPQLITCPAFCRALIQAGILTAADKPRRVVVDARRGHVVIVHVEYLGDERLLEVISTLDGALVRESGDASLPPAGSGR
jgi:hypothetical protein